MPFLIRNIKPNRQPVTVRNEANVYELAHNEQVVLDIRNITPEMFLQSMRGEITTLFVGRMPVSKPVEPQIEAEEKPEVVEEKEVSKTTAKKSKPQISE